MNNEDKKLEENFFVDIEGMNKSVFQIQVINPKLIGEGRSLRVYQAEVNVDENTTKTMIIKELKKNIGGEISTDSKRTYIESLLEGIYQKPQKKDLVNDLERQKFIDDFKKNKKLYRILEDDMVEPIYLSNYEGKPLAFYETNNARSLDNYKSLDILRTIEVMLSVVKILKNIHDENMVYMDLKPSNILYDYEKRKVKLFDFDASIELSKKEEVTKIYGPSQKSFLAPELKNTSDMDTLREYMLDAGIDRFMFGSNLFYLLTGKYLEDNILNDQDIIKDLINGELKKIKNRIFLDGEINKQLIDLILACVKIYDRHITDNDIIESLEKIKKSIDEKMRLPLLDLIDAGHILDKHPLYNYINEDSNINVGIIADNEKAKLYFDLIFAPFIAEGVDLNINFYYKKSSDFHNYLLNRAPLLKDTCKIRLDGKEIYNNIDEKITDEPYANINFTSVDKFDEVNDFDKNDYVLVIENKTTKEDDLGEKIFEKTKNDNKKRIIIVKSFDISRDREDKEFNNTSLIHYDQIKMARNDKDDFSGKILDQAFEVHCFYELSSQERIDRDELFDRFINGNDLYNVKSSLRAALSIKYKLYDCKIHNSLRPYRDFSRLIRENVPLDLDKPEGPSFRDKMAYMEHHSWNKFMITEAYVKPSDDEFFVYAYKYGNDHRNKKAKPYPFHPLISNYHLKTFDSEEIDEIDRVSENIRKAQEKSLEDSLQSLKANLNFLTKQYEYPDNIINGKLKTYLIKLRNVIENIIKGDKDSQAIYKFLDKRIKELFRQGTSEISSDVVRIYSSIDEVVQIIITNKNYKNYREIDYNLIDAIAYIIYGSVDILYKPFVDEEGCLWKNIAGVLKFRPRQVVFIKDNDKKIDNKFEIIKRFLHDKRKLISTEIRIIDQEDVGFDIKNHLEKNILFDFTGNTIKQARFDSRIKNDKQIPYVIYEGNNNWDGDYEGISYNLMRPSLSIEETFYLNNARLDKEDKINSFLDLDIYADSLWEIYNSIEANLYRKYIYTLNNGQKSFTFPLNNIMKSGREVEVGLNEKISQIEMDSYKPVIKILDLLVQKGFINSYDFQKMNGYLGLRAYDRMFLTKLLDFLAGCAKNRADKIELVKLNYRLDFVEEPRIQRPFYYYLVSSNLRCTNTIGLDNLIPEEEALYLTDNDIKFYLYNFSQFLESYNKFSKSNDIKVFDIINEKNPSYAFYNLDEENVKLNLSYGSLAFRNFFSREGNALETYAFFKIARFQDIFDNVGLNIEVDWKAEDDFDEESELIRNEIDIVCIKGLTTFLISCKQGKLKNEFIYEIGYHAKKFGIDTVPIIINSYDKYIKSDIERIRNRCKQSGVLLIERDVLEGNLKGYFEELIISK